MTDDKKTTIVQPTTATGDIPVEEKPPKCDHIGHWTPAGIFPVDNPNAITLIVVSTCKRCGDSSAKSIRLQKFNIAKLKNNPLITKS